MNKIYEQWRSTNLSPKLCTTQFQNAVNQHKTNLLNAVSNTVNGVASTVPVRVDDILVQVDELTYEAAVFSSTNPDGIITVTEILPDGETRLVSVRAADLVESFKNELEVAQLQGDLLSSLLAMVDSEASMTDVHIQIQNLYNRATTATGLAFVKLVNTISTASTSVSEFLANFSATMVNDNQSNELQPFKFTPIGEATGTSGMAFFLSSAVKKGSAYIASAIDAVTGWFASVVDVSLLYGPKALGALLKEVSYTVRSSFYWQAARYFTPLAYILTNFNDDEPAVQFNNGLDALDPGDNRLLGYGDPTMSEYLRNAMIAAGCIPGVTYAIPTIGATFYAQASVSVDPELPFYGVLGFVRHTYERSSVQVFNSLYRPGETTWTSNDDLYEAIERVGHSVLPFSRSFGEYSNPGFMNADFCNAYFESSSLPGYGLWLLADPDNFYTAFNQGNFSEEWGWLPSAFGIEDAPSSIISANRASRSEALQYILNQVPSRYMFDAMNQGLTAYFNNVATSLPTVPFAHIPVSDVLPGGVTLLADTNYQTYMEEQGERFLVAYAITLAAVAFTAAEIKLGKQYRQANRDYEIAFYDSSVDRSALHKLKVKRDVLSVLAGIPVVTLINSIFTGSNADSKQSVQDGLNADQRINEIINSSDTAESKLDRIIQLISGESINEDITRNP